MAGLSAVATSRSSKLPRARGPDHIALVTYKVVGRLIVLMQIDVEVVEPEGGHHLLQLVRAVDVAQQALGLELFDYGAGGVFEVGEQLALFGIHILGELGALRAFEVLVKLLVLRRLHVEDAMHALAREAARGRS